MVDIFEPRLAPLKAEFVIESGETVETILKVAHDKSVDMIVLGVRDAFLHGVHVRTSVAYRIMAASTLPGCELPVGFGMVWNEPVDYFLRFTGDLGTNSRVATAN